MWQFVKDNPTCILLVGHCGLLSAHDFQGQTAHQMPADSQGKQQINKQI